MTAQSVVLPSKPKVVTEEDSFGVFEIEGLYPGYGHTLGNSLRRIILSSLPGVAVTSVKIDGVSHEFSTIEGVQEDVVMILLNLKKSRLKMESDEPQTLSAKKKGEGALTFGDFAASNSNVEIMNPDQVIATLTDKKAEIDMEITVEKGLGYVPKEQLKDDKVDIGTIALDGVFTPIRRVSYEVENMRVGDRTDFNKLRITIETNGTWDPKQALEHSIALMIDQLKAVVGFKEDDLEKAAEGGAEEIHSGGDGEEDDNGSSDVLKTRIETLDLSTRTLNALSNANIRTLGGLVKKKEKDLLDIDRLGQKGLDEIKEVLVTFDLTLKEDN